jgi:hypothetical protein
VLSLASSVALGCGLAGCSDAQRQSNTAATAETTEQETTRQPTPRTGSPVTTDTLGKLDLREANVVGVTVESQTGRYRFDVTLQHDDSGEDGYANWWQVERLDGTNLGRRTLLHPHTNQPFTRSNDVEIPPAVSCVVVRGHDQTHGYGGRAMLVDLESGATSAVNQGTGRQSFDEVACPRH